MSSETNRVEGAAAALRRDFDRAFAEAPKAAGPSLEDVLAIRIGGDPFVLRMSETAGLHADRKIVPVPSPLPELLGVVGLRGRMVPVYDLGALLGYAASPVPRWFVLARAAKPVGLAFEVFEAHTRVPQQSFAESRGDSAGGDHVRGAAHVGGGVRPVLSVGSMLEAIARRARSSVSPKER